MNSKKLERFEAYIEGHGFKPHRHDTYAIGRTLSGIHCFNYRGKKRYSLPGNSVIIYPDELHDGEAGDINGFSYRIVYIEPANLQKVLGGKPLPYIKNGVSDDPRLSKAIDFLCDSFEYDLDPLQEDDVIYDIAVTLSEVSNKRRGRVAYDYRAAEIAREYIHESLDKAISIHELSIITERSKWSLSRDFRVLYGTSPYRYLTMRRLDNVKSCLLNGDTLVEAALKSGFVDQSHMSNHFKRTLGISPLRWLTLMELRRNKLKKMAPQQDLWVPSSTGNSPSA